MEVTEEEGQGRRENVNLFTYTAKENFQNTLSSIYSSKDKHQLKLLWDKPTSLSLYLGCYEQQRSSRAKHNLQKQFTYGGSQAKPTAYFAQD